MFPDVTPAAQWMAKLMYIAPFKYSDLSYDDSFQSNVFVLRCLLYLGVPVLLLVTVLNRMNYISAYTATALSLLSFMWPPFFWVLPDRISKAGLGSAETSLSVLAIVWYPILMFVGDITAVPSNKPTTRVGVWAYDLRTELSRLSLQRRKAVRVVFNMGFAPLILCAQLSRRGIRDENALKWFGCGCALLLVLSAVLWMSLTVEHQALERAAKQLPTHTSPEEKSSSSLKSEPYTPNTYSTG